MTPRSPYLVGPLYDWAFFLMPPVVALWLGILISGTSFSDASIEIAGVETTLAGLGLGVLIHAHLVAVGFRSHLNAEVFARHRWRFVAVPIVLWLAITWSVWIAAAATVVATFWDAWHSGAQTFGFGRIYERNAGNPPELGRRMDFWLNQLLYLGPILAGATLADHIHSFDAFDGVGSAFLTAVPAEVEGLQGVITRVILAAGVLFIAAYAVIELRRWRGGHRASPLKVFLTATTGLCSIYSWGFNTWGEAFFIMNAFHAVQYLALVWAMEGTRILALVGAPTTARGRWLAAALFVGSVLAYGVFAELLVPDTGALWALTMVVSLMHFWFDGFVWSVRRRQI